MVPVCEFAEEPALAGSFASVTFLAAVVFLVLIVGDDAGSGIVTGVLD